MNLHLPHLRVPPHPTRATATPPISTPAGGRGRSPSNTSNGAATSATDAPRTAHMGAPCDTAGRGLVHTPGETARATAAGRTFRKITPADVQVAWAHNDVEPVTLAAVQRAEFAAARLGDVDRAARYRVVARAFLARAQRDVRP